MPLPLRSIRLQKYSELQLDRLSYEDGEIFYDDVNNTLRLMNGRIPGGRNIATQEWANNKLATDLANYATLTYTNTQLGLKAPINNPTFTGTVNGITSTMVGLGNVTNESKATMFASPTFTGTLTADITSSNTLGTTGLATLNSLSVTTGASVTGTLDVTGTSTLAGLSATTGSFSSTLGVTGTSTLAGLNATTGNFSSTLNSTGNFSVATNKVTVDSSTGNTSVAGTLAVTGNATTSAQLIANSAVVTNNMQAGTASVTNDVTVGTNVNISTLPTQIQHATNKQYVDTRALALAIAMS